MNKLALSVAAIFSRRCSRVEKTQALEDGLTEPLLQTVQLLHGL